MDAGGGFAAATALRRVGDGEGVGNGEYEGEILEGWDIVGNTDGGYLLAIAGRALALATGRPDPIAVRGHYLSPGRAGPVRVQVELLKAGKRFSTASARLVAGDRTLLSVVGTLGELDDSAEALHADGAAPALPPPDDCVRLVGTDSFPPPFMDRVDVRLHPDDAGFVSGAPTGSPRLRGWFRLLEGEPVDPLALLLAVDSFPPTIFNADLPVSWSPTVELTAHLRARPAPGWLACDYRTRFISGGFLEVDGEVWDATGALVAQSRQLALVPRD